jgi:hypothetical protein
MMLLVGCLLFALCGFLLVLTYFELTPQAALKKITNRFVGSVRPRRSVQPDALYRRVAARSDTLPVHNPILLNLNTSDGSGQACHPDVVHIPEGFGEKKWTYWMVCTPYPYGDFVFENPEIFVSYDGLQWVVPDGLHNPLVQKPENAFDHNSDPDLVFHENKLWLFYRETLRGKSPAENRIYLLQSVDGIFWSPPVEVLRDDAGKQLLSPAVLHDGRWFWMWTVEIRQKELTLMRRRSIDGIHWSEPPEAASLVGLEQGRKPWHIDVIQDENHLSAILVSCAQFGGSGGRIHYVHSDDGLRWNVNSFLFEQAYEFERNLQYRATLRKVHGLQQEGTHPEGPNQEYELWYSAASSAELFSIAYVRLRRSGNELFPAEPRPAPGLAKAETLTVLQ